MSLMSNPSCGSPLLNNFSPMNLGLRTMYEIREPAVIFFPNLFNFFTASICINPPSDLYSAATEHDMLRSVVGTSRLMIVSITR